MKPMEILLALLLCLGMASSVLAQGNLDIDTPAITALRGAMQQRHAELAPYYASGSVGLTAEGLVAVRDATAVPLAQRGKLNALVAAENRDRDALYREIARANGHPEWTEQVRDTFSQRWIGKAQGGWWVRARDGNWARK